MNPINMRKWEIEALLDGRKTTARRLIRPQPDRVPSQDERPYLPGDVLWVRENIKMPKKDARIFLQVTAVHGEHLQDIDSEGILREGVRSKKPEWLKVDFADLWNSDLKPADLDIFEWWTNPWVWVIEFKQIGQKMEIDKIINSLKEQAEDKMDWAAEDVEEDNIFVQDANALLAACSVLESLKNAGDKNA